ncbi:hypothetical protein TWF694_005328 [Orbilia ellipsospora]|uniref:F-box domain-containing protein n=1 Tax=Orbilia ellipsospora TaxID=2528407 RepID=A0AAV9WU41_9PEZI
MGTKSIQSTISSKLTVAQRTPPRLPQEIWDNIFLDILQYDFCQRQTLIRPISCHFNKMYTNIFHGLTPLLWAKVFKNLNFRDLICAVVPTCQTFSCIVLNGGNPTICKTIFKEKLTPEVEMLVENTTSDRINAHPIFAKIKMEMIILRSHLDAELYITYPPSADRIGLQWPDLAAANYYKFRNGNATSPPADCLTVCIPSVGRRLMVSKKKCIEMDKRMEKRKERIWDNYLHYEHGVKRRKSGNNGRGESLVPRGRSRQLPLNESECMDLYPGELNEADGAEQLKKKQPEHKGAVTVMDVMGAVFKILQKPIPKKYLDSLMDGDMTIDEDTPLYEILTEDSAFRGIAGIYTKKGPGRIALEIGGFKLKLDQ